MSVLIKGMKMPKSCYDCDMLELSGVVGCNHAYDTKNSDWGRALNCPLIELPPHGDLIDRDEQIERAWRLNLSTRELIAEMLKTAPTILEAEVEE